MTPPPDKSSPGPALDLSRQHVTSVSHSSVRDKVRKWQNTGGGVIKATDGVVGDSDTEPAPPQPSKKSNVSAKSAESGLSQKSTDVKSPASSPAPHPQLRPRSKTTDADARIVSPPAAPDPQTLDPITPVTDPERTRVRPVAVERTPGGDVNVNSRLAKPVRLDGDLRSASAPRKRVVSDRAWVKHRSPTKEEPEAKEKPPKQMKPQVHIAWVREPMLPKPESVHKLREKRIEVPHMFTFNHKLPIKKPNPWDDIKQGDDAPLMENDECDITIEPRRRSEPRILINSPLGRIRTKATGGREEPVEILEERLPINKDHIKSPHIDASNGSRLHRREKSWSGREIDGSLNVRPIGRNSSIQKSPPLGARGRESISGYNDETQRSRSRELHNRSPSRNDIRRDFSIQKSPPRLCSPDAFPRHRRRRSDDDVFVDKHYERRDSKPPTAEHDNLPKLNQYHEIGTERKRSYNGGDTLSHEDQLEFERRMQTHPNFPTRVATWLSSTPDPFTNPSLRKSSRRPKSRHDDDQGISEVNSGSSKDHSSGQDSDATDLRTPTGSEKGRIHGKGSELDPEIEVEFSSETSVTTLRRSRVTKRNLCSPTKERHDAAPSVIQSEASSSFVSSSHNSTSIYTYSDATNDESQFRNTSRRQFPSKGQPLSTIPSVDSLSTNTRKTPPSISESSDVTARPTPKCYQPRPEELHQASPSKSRAPIGRQSSKTPSLKRSKSAASARSVRSARSRLATATVADILDEIAYDEEKYMPELRTLAGGVIPVLFKCVLSKSSATIAAGLFSRFAVGGSADHEKEAIDAIHDMGVALERLKKLHMRMPKLATSGSSSPASSNSANAATHSFLIWAQGAHRIYAKYVQTWRLGFQDVVVNLVPADNASTTSGTTAHDLEVCSLADGGLPRNAEGYVVDEENGALVDVAFLLKRPLLRLKFLVRSIKGLNTAHPTPLAAELSAKFEELMEEMRRRVAEERNRMEDQAAARIDTTRARDPAGLAPLEGVKIEPRRCVRARDFFAFHLLHSSGQEVDCRVEILLRDEAPAGTEEAGGVTGGDVLICQVDKVGRWLLFPPVMLHNISARLGDEPGVLVVMIRGHGKRGSEWREVFQLRTLNAGLAAEWLIMLGEEPAPPAFDRATLFMKGVWQAEIAESSSRGSSMLSGSVITESTLSESVVSKDQESHVPLGERAGPGARRWGSETPKRREREISPITPPSSGNEGSVDRRSQEKESKAKTFGSKSKREPMDERRMPRDLNEAMSMAGGSSSPTLKRSKATRYRSTSSASPTTGKDKQSPTEHSSRSSPAVKSPVSSTSSRGYSVWMPPSETGASTDDDDSMHFSTTSSIRGEIHGKSSPMLSAADPPKDRTKKESRGHIRSGSYSMGDSKDHIKSGDYMMSGAIGPALPRTPDKKNGSSSAHPSSAPPKLQKQDHSPSSDEPPPPPPHKTPPSNGLNRNAPVLTPTGQPLKRRSSSPLKHEWHPPTDSDPSISGSDSYSESDYSDEDSFLDSDEDSMSDLSESDIHRHPTVDLSTIPEDDELTPSQSASQAGVLPPEHLKPQSPSTPEQPDPNTLYFSTAAKPMVWRDGTYKDLTPHDSHITIHPGALRVWRTFPSDSSNTSATSSSPLAEFDLSPSAILHISTPVDVIVTVTTTRASHLRMRHPTAVLFRVPQLAKLRVAEAIERAKRAHPRVMAGEIDTSGVPLGRRMSEAERFERMNPGRKPSASGKRNSSSWWGGGSRRSSSFRKSATFGGGGSSTVGHTEKASSARTSSSSVMRQLAEKLAAKAGINVEKSSLFSRTVYSSAGGSSSSMTGARGGGAASQENLSAVIGPGGQSEHPLGAEAGSIIWHRKCVLSEKGGGPDWRRLGDAELYVLPALRGGVQARVDAPVGLHTGEEKRIVLDYVQSGVPRRLDVVLGETCFERLRKGLMFQVFEGQGVGVRDRGGVSGVRRGVYCVQLKTKAEEDRLFQLVGRMRY